MLVGTRQQLAKLPPVGVNVGDSVIVPSSSLKVLGVTFDQHLTYVDHASSISSSCGYYLREIARVKDRLDSKALKTLVHAVIHSRLDFCNSLLYGAQDQVINSLQLVQNRAARLVARVPRRQRITPVRQHLHWLPVEARIRFKVLSLIRSTGMQSLLNVVVPARVTRSAQSVSFDARANKTKTADRSFAVAGPREWNALPAELRQPDVINWAGRVKNLLFSWAYSIDT